MGLTPFKNFIRDKCGFRFNDIRSYNLEKGIRSRMASTGARSYEDYHRLVLSDENEFNSLVNFITVNETYFYREPVHLRLLSDIVVPELLKIKNAGQKIKILSAGCSTGEEPYSILMALMEKYGGSALSLFSVSGVDIDSQAISKAKEGVFSSYSFRNFHDELIEKYFIRIDNNSYKIKEHLREAVSFTAFNLLSDSYPQSLMSMDVIFYRNVSIYFDSEIQRRIFEKLSNALTDSGFIILSSTETMSHNIGMMTLEEIDNVFVYRKRPGLALANMDKGETVKKQKKSHSEVKKTSCFKKPSDYVDKGVHAAIAKELKTIDFNVHAAFQEALSLANAKRYDDALKCVDAIVAKNPDFKKAYALKAGILINQKQLDAAESICLMCIETDRWCMESALLLGIIAKIRDDYDIAVARFKETVYIKTSCWLAHFYLADIYRDIGEIEKSCREYEITINLIERENIVDHGLTFFPISFSVDQIAHLCRNNLNKLKQRL
jgi:chemotaxis protein methyltransferase CheR